MNDRYAVLEWEDGVDDVASVIGKDLSMDFAAVLVSIAPEHLYREMVTMQELNNRR